MPNNHRLDIWAKWHSALNEILSLNPARILVNSVTDGSAICFLAYERLSDKVDMPASAAVMHGNSLAHYLLFAGATSCVVVRGIGEYKRSREILAARHRDLPPMAAYSDAKIKKVTVVEPSVPEATPDFWKNVLALPRKTFDTIISYNPTKLPLLIEPGFQLAAALATLPAAAVMATAAAAVIRTAHTQSHNHLIATFGALTLSSIGNFVGWYEKEDKPNRNFAKHIFLNNYFWWALGSIAAGGTLSGAPLDVIATAAFALTVPHSIIRAIPRVAAKVPLPKNLPVLLNVIGWAAAAVQSFHGHDSMRVQAMLIFIASQPSLYALLNGSGLYQMSGKIIDHFTGAKRPNPQQAVENKGVTP